VRTALYCRLLARQNNGKFLLRIEDTDQARSTVLYEEAMIDSLNRCGLERDAGPKNPDENGPYYQMKRLEIYNTYVQQLLEE
jgi:glutamyl/glutaminyl-tRNA synthetase